MAESEYGGTSPLPNSVQDLGPEGRKLKPHEKVKLIYLTGQDEDPNAPRKSGFMYGVDPDFPEFDWDDDVAPRAGQ